MRCPGCGLSLPTGENFCSKNCEEIAELVSRKRREKEELEESSLISEWASLRHGPISDRFWKENQGW
jgi:hypothetical protein